MRVITSFSQRNGRLLRARGFSLLIRATAMIGHVIMEIEHDEMIAAVQFYLNRDVFDADGSLRVRHKANVSEVRQHGNGNFVIEFNGWQLPPKEQPDGTDDIS
jgi:hypothetical protein